MRISDWSSDVCSSDLRLCQQAVALEDRLQAFLEQHVDRLAQAEQQVLGRRAAVFLVVQRPVALGPVPVGGAQSGVLVRLEGTRARRHEAETGRRNQALDRKSTRLNSSH